MTAYSPNQNPISKSQLIAEIDLIPEHKLEDLYQLINNFRISLNFEEDCVKKIMSFAGIWDNFTDE